MAHRVATSRRGRCEDLANADRIEKLEGPKVPPKAPPHHPIDIVDRVGDVRGHPRRVDEGRRKRFAQKLSSLVARIEQHADALLHVVDVLGRFKRGHARGLTWTVFEGLEIERPDFAFARSTLPPFVKASACFFPQQTLVEHALQERRHGKRGPIGLTWQSLGEVAHDVRQDVDAGDVHRAKGGAPRAAECRTGDRVDLFNRVTAAGDGFKRADNTVQGDVVADEVWRVFRDDDALAKMMVGEPGDRRRDSRIGFERRDQFEKTQIPWWIEEMCSDPMASKVIAASLREHADRDTRRVGADDGSRAAGLVDPREQLLFDVESFDHGLDNPVRRGEP